MRRLLQTVGLSVAILAGLMASAFADDLRDGVPSDVYLATYHKHNPERDYQQEHWDRVWQTIEETQICTRFLAAIENQMDEGDREEFAEFREMLSDALEPVQWEALAECTESVYAQRMAMPTSQHLVLLRLPEGAAESFVTGIANLLELAEEGSQGKVIHATETIRDVELHTLQLPAEVPFQPTVGAVEDVYLFASTKALAQQSIELLGNPAAESKFDDPRLAAALAELPEFEDGVTFFDGKELFGQLRQIGTFIQQVSGGDENALRVAQLLDEVFTEFDVFEFEVTVEYTEGYQNRSAAFGRVSPDTRNKVLGRMTANQEPFENWDRWVPASASGYSLATGVNLHPLYEWLMEMIPAHFPEAQPGLDKFETLQQEYDIHLDRDILQAFTGGSVSVTLAPDPDGPPTASGQSVTFLKCEKPDRIRELLHRGVDALTGIPQLQAQNIGLVEVEDMEGFEELTAGVFAFAGVRPVIGFQDGWMVIGSHADAVQTVLDTREGEGETITSTETFQQFGMDVEGPVISISQANLAEQTRGISEAIQGVGTMLPMIMGMAAQQGQDLSGAQDFFALLPAVGQIIGTLDFYENQLSVTQPGPDEQSYIRHTVILVRPPAEEAE